MIRSGPQPRVKLTGLVSGFRPGPSGSLPAVPWPPLTPFVTETKALSAGRGLKSFAPVTVADDRRRMRLRAVPTARPDDPPRNRRGGRLSQCPSALHIREKHASFAYLTPHGTWRAKEGNGGSPRMGWAGGVFGLYRGVSALTCRPRSHPWVDAPTKPSARCSGRPVAMPPPAAVCVPAPPRPHLSAIGHAFGYTEL